MNIAPTPVVFGYPEKLRLKISRLNIFLKLD
jgi:hypothetical protein